MKPLVTALIVAAFVVALSACSEAPKESKNVQQEPAILAFDYQLKGREDISHKDTPRMVVRVYLETDKMPSKERMIETAKQIWSKEQKAWKEFTVFMIFGEIKDFDSGAYGIAEFTPVGLKEFRVNDTPLQMIELRNNL